MVRYNGSVTVPFSRERVWKVMSDWTNLAKWDLNITRSERVGPAAADGVGAQFSCTFDLKGKQSQVDYGCVQFDEGEVAQFVGTTSLGPGVGIRTQDTVALRDAPGSGTVIDAEFDLRFRGLLTPLSFLMNGSMQETGPIVSKSSIEWSSVFGDDQSLVKDIDQFVRGELGDGSED